MLATAQGRHSLCKPRLPLLLLGAQDEEGSDEDEEGSEGSEEEEELEVERKARALDKARCAARAAASASVARVWGGLAADLHPTGE